MGHLIVLQALIHKHEWETDHGLFGVCGIEMFWNLVHK